MKIIDRNGNDFYFEYMVKIHLDDTPIFLATGDIAGKVISAYMDIPSGISNGIDPVECTGSISTVNVDVYNDDNCNFSKIMASHNKASEMYFRKVELFLVKKGVESLMYTGLLRNIKPKDVFETGYTLEIADMISEVFKKPTLLSKSGGVYANWFNEDLANKPVGNGNVTVTKYLNLSNKVEVKFSGHPLDVAKLLLDNMFKDSIKYNSVIFDQVKADTYYGVLGKCQFIFTEYVKDTLDYITKNIFRICNCFPYLNKAGELCIIRQKPISVLQNTETYFIDKDDIINLNNKNIDFSKITNHVMIKRANKDIVHYYYDGDSYTAFKKFIPDNPKEITLNYGSMTDADIDQIGNDIAFNLFSMFSIAYSVIMFELVLTEFEALNVGDTIGLTHDKLIDSSNGERGIVETGINLDLYCKLDVDLWGGFLPTYIGATFYDENFVQKSYNVSQTVTNLWYNSVLEGNIKNKAYGDFLRG